MKLYNRSETRICRAWGCLRMALVCLCTIGMVAWALPITALASGYVPGLSQVEIGPGAGLTEADGQPSKPEQSDAAAGQPGSTGAAQGQVLDPATLPDIAASYSAYIHGGTWSAETPDHTVVKAPTGGFLTAFRASLEKPEGFDLGVAYAVNLSGSWWLAESRDGAENGGAGGDSPLEGVRFWLTGSMADYYEICYRVLQNGVWTDWVRNGETAGTVSAAIWVEGFAAAVVKKGAEPPEMVERSVDPTRPMIALTFDDGPSATVTGRILNALEQNGGRATFFVVGSRVQSNAASILRAYQLGCEIGNHTYGHKYISKIGADAIRSELGTTNQLVAGITGVSPVLMRPPGGFYDSASLGTVGELGMSAVLWSIDTRDWQHKNAQKTIDTVLSQVKDGDIILMHDLYTASADAAEVLIPELTRRGYQLVTVSELASYRGGLAPGHIYSRFRP